MLFHGRSVTFKCARRCSNGFGPVSRGQRGNIFELQPLKNTNCQRSTSLGFISSAPCDATVVHEHCNISQDGKNEGASLKSTKDHDAGDSDDFFGAVDLEFLNNMTQCFEKFKPDVIKPVYLNIIKRLRNLFGRSLPYDEIRSKLKVSLEELEGLPSFRDTALTKKPIHFLTLKQYLSSYSENDVYVQRYFESNSRKLARISSEAFLCITTISICHLRLGEWEKAFSFVKDKCDYTTLGTLLDFILSEYLFYEIQHEFKTLQKRLKCSEEGSSNDIGIDLDKFSLEEYAKEFPPISTCEEEYFMPLTVGGSPTALEGIGNLLQTAITEFQYLPSALTTARLYIYLFVIQPISLKMCIGKSDLNQFNGIYHTLEGHLWPTIYESADEITSSTLITLFQILCWQQKMEKIVALARLIIQKNSDEKLILARILNFRLNNNHESKHENFKKIYLSDRIWRNNLKTQLLNSALVNFAKGGQWLDLIKFYREFGTIEGVSGQEVLDNSILDEKCQNLHPGLQPDPDLVGSYLEYVMLALGRLNSPQLVPFISYLFKDTNTISHLLKSGSLYNTLMMVGQTAYCKNLFEISKKLKISGFELNFWNMCYSNISSIGEIDDAREILIELVKNNGTIFSASVTIYLEHCAEFGRIENFEEGLYLLTACHVPTTENEIQVHSSSPDNEKSNKLFDEYKFKSEQRLQLKSESVRSAYSLGTMGVIVERFDPNSLLYRSFIGEKINSFKPQRNPISLKKSFPYKKNFSECIVGCGLNNRVISSSVIFMGIEMYIGAYNFRGLWELLNLTALTPSIITAVMTNFRHLITLDHFRRADEEKKSSLSNEVFFLLESCKSIEGALSNFFLIQIVDDAAKVVSYFGKLNEFNRLNHYLSHWKLPLTEDFYIELIKILARDDPQRRLLENNNDQIKNEIELNFPSPSLSFYAEILLFRLFNPNLMNLSDLERFLNGLVDSIHDRDQVLLSVLLLYYAKKNNVNELHSVWKNIKKFNITLSTSLKVKLLYFLGDIKNKEIFEEILNHPIVEELDYLMALIRGSILCELEDSLLNVIKSKASAFSKLSRTQWGFLFDYLQDNYNQINLSNFFISLEKLGFNLHPKSRSFTLN